MSGKILRIFIWGTAGLLLFFYHAAYSFDNFVSSSLALALADLAGLYLSSLAINRILVPKLLYRRKTFVFVISLPLVFVLSSLIIQMMQRLWYHFIQSLSPKELDVLGSLAYQVFNTYIIQFLGSVCICVFRLTNDQRIAQMRYETLEKEKARTELNFLKAQINPHFLFNSLNSLYAEIDKTNASARNIVLKFSEMLRYQLYECNVDRIPIEKEIEYLRNYVELERIRKEDYLRVNFEISEAVHGFEIAPLIFITFIENAFKYASNHETSENRLEIKIQKNNNLLELFVTNTRDRVLSRDLSGDHGIGIKNVQRRLELLYPGRHQLSIAQGDHLFEICLKIELE